MNIKPERSGIKKPWQTIETPPGITPVEYGLYQSLADIEIKIPKTAGTRHGTHVFHFGSYPPDPDNILYLIRNLRDLDTENLFKLVPPDPETDISPRPTQRWQTAVRPHTPNTLSGWLKLLGFSGENRAKLTASLKYHELYSIHRFYTKEVPERMILFHRLGRPRQPHEIYLGFSVSAEPTETEKSP